MNSTILAGEYLLQNVREMASGFLLKPDQTFQFFFTYGALDRFASGHWEQKGNEIVFNSRQWPGADFTIVQSEAAAEEGILLQLEKPNPMLAAYLQVSLAGGAQESWIQFRQHGYLHLPPQDFDSISVLFEFCPERFTRLPVTKGHNSFTIRPEESMFELFLQDFVLTVTTEGLKGRHPMMEGDAFLYQQS